MKRLLFLCLLAAMAPAAAAPVKPHYVSQRSDRAYMREGPSFQHRILWVYKHKGYPFQVLGAYDVWRRVRTADGTTGWMSANMLTDQRTVLVTGRERAPLYADPQARAKIVAYAMPGAVARLDACVLQACKVSATGLKGWIDKDRVWGADRDEVFK
jgi:SH3-like domain-containing protein